MRRAASLALVSALGGCAVVAGLDGDRTIADAPPTTATGTGSGGAGGATTTTTTTNPKDASAGCTLASYPPPPAVKDAGGGIDFVVALRTIELGDTGNLVGLDLDGKCTGQGDGPSCLHPAWMEADLDDAEDGRDAQTAGLFAKLALGSAGKIGSEGFTAGAEGGRWTMLMRVRGYNGQLDDDQVEVTLFPSSGLPKIDRPPKWLGSDKWPIPPRALVDGKSPDKPRFVDTKAYVSGGWLVASLPESEMVLAAAGSYMAAHFTAAFTVARLETSPTGWALRDGTIAARWKVTDLFASLPEIRQDDSPICTDTAFYGPVKSEICQNVDIYSGISTPTTVCDSISVGIGFTADPALVGPVEEPEPLSPGCPPETDPASDSCP